MAPFDKLSCPSGDLTRMSSDLLTDTSVWGLLVALSC